MTAPIGGFFKKQVSHMQNRWVQSGGFQNLSRQLRSAYQQSNVGDTFQRLVKRNVPSRWQASIQQMVTWLQNQWQRLGVRL